MWQKEPIESAKHVSSSSANSDDTDAVSSTKRISYFSNMKSSLRVPLTIVSLKLQVDL